MEIERRKRNHAHINIAPLVDVVFLLLIFFLLTSHLIQEPAIKIALPRSSTAEVHRDKAKTVYISKEGTIFFMEKKVDLRDLRKEIKKSLEHSGSDFVRIKADKECEIGLLVSVIDEIRLAGIKNLSIVTERK